jgi:hypothetical protein
MDSDNMTFMLLSALGPMMSVVAIIMIAMMLGPVILYILSRWRANRGTVPDNQVGAKFALHYFAMTAFQLALAGGALLLYAMISPGPSDAKGPIYRAALGMLMPAGLVLGVHLALLRRTNDDMFPSVRRLFAGYNLLVTGLIGFIALVVGFQMLLQKGSTHGAGHMAASMVLVYCTAWSLIGWRFGQLVLGVPDAANGPPSAGVGPGAMPPTMPTPPAAAAQGGLPSLGGGSFPPIDQK